MQKIFSIESPRGHYAADACLIACIDDRFTTAIDALRTHLGLTHADVVRFTGGAKTIAAPPVESDRDALLRQIEIAVRLHKTQKVILTTHEDCGAAGGSVVFGNNPDTERDAHKQWLDKAAGCVKEKFPTLQIMRIYLTFEGAEQP